MEERLAGLAWLWLPQVEASHDRAKPRRPTTPNWVVRLAAPLIAAIRGY